MQAASTIRSSYAMSVNSRETLRVLSRNSPSLSFMMLALWIAVTRLPAVRARMLEGELARSASTPSP